MSKYIWLNGYRVNREELGDDLVKALGTANAIDYDVSVRPAKWVDDKDFRNVIEAIKPLYKYVYGRL
jgi:hypothetical protein